MTKADDKTDYSDWKTYSHHTRDALALAERVALLASMLGELTVRIEEPNCAIEVRARK